MRRMLLRLAVALLLGLPAAAPGAAAATPLPPSAERTAAAALVLGRWQAFSTAGAAILDVLTVTPERVRWGTWFNGRCDSAYALTVLPDGHGTYPDDLIRPAQPRAPLYRVVRLTLLPGPCRSGDAVLQLAVPLDEPNRAFATTYAAGGRLTGWYGELQRLPPPAGPQP